MAKLQLEERVAALESQYRNLYDDIAEVRHKVDTCDGRQDALAENLVDVRKMVHHINDRLDVHDRRFDTLDQRLDTLDQRFEGVDQRFEGVDKRFEGVEKTLEQHGEMLQKILERLPSPN